MNNKSKFYFAGIMGAILGFFIGWEFNIPYVGWIALPLLIFCFRNIEKWYKAIPIGILIAATKFATIYGGWDFELPLMIAFSALVSIPVLASLYLDRFYYKRLKPLLATLVFPTTYILFDYLLLQANLGMTFSLAYNQSTFIELIQSASLFGSWFVGFIVAWFAPIAVLTATNIKNLTPYRKTIVFFFSILAVLLSFGCLRLVFDMPQSQTVKIASITEPHERDYWLITDEGTPNDQSDFFKPEMASIQQNLFNSSQKAADFGAKIIFWTEGNCPFYEDDYPEFIEKARAFAMNNHVYFMPTVVELLYGQTKNRNLAIMINPDGEIEYSYEKTISYYPSDSDGIIPVIDTPYGKLSTAICFDMDYPDLISQASDADIMLVPGYDTKKIDDYHTRVAFMRGIENGFSTVRQSNEGSSISADYLGNTLTYQNYFRTNDRIMLSDVPMMGVTTLYSLTGELFIYIVMSGFVFINGWYIVTLLIRRKQK